MAHLAQQYLDVYQREHEITMKVLRAYPADKADLRPHAKCKTARELAWVFAVERVLGTSVMHDQLAELMENGGGSPPPPPESWDEVLAAIEARHKEFSDLIASYSDEDFRAPVHFFAGPKKIEPLPRNDVAWFLLHDQIHHRGQFSIYLRMADGKVPSIYGPSADEPWT